MVVEQRDDLSQLVQESSNEIIQFRQSSAHELDPDAHDMAFLQGYVQNFGGEGLFWGMRSGISKLTEFDEYHQGAHPEIREQLIQKISFDIVTFPTFKVDPREMTPSKRMEMKTTMDYFNGMFSQKNTEELTAMTDGLEDALLDFAQSSAA